MIVASLCPWLWLHCARGCGFLVLKAVVSLFSRLWFSCVNGCGFLVPMVVVSLCPWLWSSCAHGCSLLVSMVARRPSAFSRPSRHPIYVKRVSPHCWENRTSPGADWQCRQICGMLSPTAPWIEKSISNTRQQPSHGHISIRKKTD